MKKNNMLKMLEIIYDETNNTRTASRAKNYWSTGNDMTEEDYVKLLLHESARETLKFRLRRPRRNTERNY